MNKPQSLNPPPCSFSAPAYWVSRDSGGKERGHKEWTKKEVEKTDVLVKTAERAEAHRIVARKREVQKLEEVTRIEGIKSKGYFPF